MNNIRIENKLFNEFEKFKSKLRCFFLFGKLDKVRFGRQVRLSGTINFGSKVHIKDYSTLRGSNIKIASNVHIHENVFIRSSEYIIIGENSTINRNSCILDKVIIGKNCSIAPNVVIVGSNHLFKDASILIKSQGSEIKGILIEDDVWIAANVTILDGVTIGYGSIVAAGAVVNKSVPPFSVVGGVPAKIIGKRN
jgi:acetyltransferase-like isoleucine patch superfamily enzyme